MAYVEVKARTVELAVEAAMKELGVDNPDRVAVEVIQEPEKGFLGMGGREAIVKVTKRKRERRRRDSRGEKRGGRSHNPEPRPQTKNQAQPNSGRGRRQEDSEPRQGRHQAKDERPVLEIEMQAEITNKFLTGLVAAYGLEGDVETNVDDEGVIIAKVNGEQCEAMVGPRGQVMQSIHELTRTVLARHGSDVARLRLDIAGYAERRRQALTIYANEIIDQLMEEGGEVVLEPMSSADRKVIHDAAAARSNVRSYSEGEPPTRYVVLAVETPAIDEEE